VHYDQANQTILTLMTLAKPYRSDRLRAEMLLFEFFFYQTGDLFILRKCILLSVCHRLNFN